MKEFLNMSGYAFYVWTSLGVFLIAITIDILQLRHKEKTVKRTIKAFLKRKKNRRSNEP